MLYIAYSCTSGSILENKFVEIGILAMSNDESLSRLILVLKAKKTCFS